MPERSTILVITLLLLAAFPAGAQQALTFGYLGQTAAVGSFSGRVEVMPVMQLIGAEAAYSPAAGTYRIVLGDREVQLAVERKMLLVNGALVEIDEAPIASPGGVAVSLDLLERSILSGFGLRLERTDWGWQVVPGVRPAERLRVRPAAADFPASTTLVFTLGRDVEATVEATPDGAVVIRFRDALPVVDGVVRSRRLEAMVVEGRELRLELAADAAMRAWHRLDGPPRVIVELGRLMPTPTPAPLLPSSGSE